MTTTVAAFEQLPSLSQELNKASGVLSHRLVQAEQYLNRLHLGIAARVQVASGRLSNHDPDEWIEELHYMKKDRHWGLVLVTYWVSNPDTTSAECFLWEAARDRKLRAVKKLPELIGELITKAAATCDEVKRQAAEMGKLAMALEEDEL